MEERLHKIIARAGICARREAEQLILAGLVTVNGELVTDLGTKADLQTDHIKVRGKLIQNEEKLVYILLNKPKGVITTVNDPEGRPSVMDLVKGVGVRIYPVGRLDFNTEGVLLMTNDGELANNLLAPKHKCPKTYLAKLSGVPDPKDVARLERGVTVDGTKFGQCQIEILRVVRNTWAKVTLMEGKNHQVKKMFEAIGHPVSKLRRIAFAFLTTKGVSIGHWRHLTETEVSRLKREDFQPLIPLPINAMLRELGVRVTLKDHEKLAAFRAEKAELDEKGGRRAGEKPARDARGTARDAKGPSKWVAKSTSSMVGRLPGSADKPPVRGARLASRLRPKQDWDDDLVLDAAEEMDVKVAPKSRKKSDSGESAPTEPKRVFAADRSEAAPRKRSDERGEAAPRKRFDERSDSAPRKRFDERSESGPRKRSDERSESGPRKRFDERSESGPRKRSDERSDSGPRKRFDERSESSSPRKRSGEGFDAGPRRKRPDEGSSYPRRDARSDEKPKTSKWVRSASDSDSGSRPARGRSEEGAKPRGARSWDDAPKPMKGRMRSEAPGQGRGSSEDRRDKPRSGPSEDRRDPKPRGARSWDEKPKVAKPGRARSDEGPSRSARPKDGASRPPRSKEGYSAGPQGARSREDGPKKWVRSRSEESSPRRSYGEDGDRPRAKDARPERAPSGGDKPTYRIRSAEEAPKGRPGSGFQKGGRPSSSRPASARNGKVSSKPFGGRPTGHRTKKK